jgi:ubiquitin C-terminal hydrolase
MSYIYDEQVATDEILIRLSRELFTERVFDRGLILRNQHTGTLRNCGNSCFINTGIQLLFNINTYRFFILNTDFNNVFDQLSSEEKRRNRKDFIRLIIIQIIFTFLTQRRTLDLSNISFQRFTKINLFRKVIEIFNLDTRNNFLIQDDSREIIVQLLSSLFIEKILIRYPPTRESTMNYLNSLSLNDISIKKCTNMDRYNINNPAVDNLQPGNLIKNYLKILSLPIKNTDSIQNAINNYQTWAKDNDPGNYVDACKSSTNTRGNWDFNIFILETFKETTTLIIQLKRFEYINGRFTKIDKPIIINQTIIIDGDTFIITGVACHTGSFDSGHYYYIKYNNGIPSIVYNDSDEYPYSNDNISKLGYIFTYQKISNTPKPTLREYEESYISRRRRINIPPLTDDDDTSSTARPRPISPTLRPISPTPRPISPVAPKSNEFYVYTTGFAYFEKNDSMAMLKILVDNVVNTLTLAGYSKKSIRFIHYDGGFELDFPRYHQENEEFINRDLTLDTIKQKIENKSNALLVDLAHIIFYYKGDPMIKIYKDSSQTTIELEPSNVVDINCFYPGYLEDSSAEFIRYFNFFKIINGRIVTFIDKGYEERIQIMTEYKGIPTFVHLDFTKTVMQINGTIGTIFNHKDRIIELNKRFWDLKIINIYKRTPPPIAPKPKTPLPIAPKPKTPPPIAPKPKTKLKKNDIIFETMRDINIYKNIRNETDRIPRLKKYN